MRGKLIFVPLFLLISMGTTQAQVSYNQEFAPDVSTPEGFRTNRTSYSAIMDVLGKNRTQISAEKLEIMSDESDSNIEKLLDLGFVGKPTNIDSTIIEKTIS